jgi:hypothetical protein
MVPEVTIPVWGLVYIPTAITIMNAIRNPRYALFALSGVQLPMCLFVDIFL